MSSECVETREDSMTRGGLSYSFSKKGGGFVEASKGKRGGEEGMCEDRERMIRRGGGGRW